VSWRDIEISRDSEGRPAIRLHGLAARVSDQNGGLRIQISLTHSAISAGAIAVVEGP
jgi:phosphopantetheinyl transferase (holo-ACP synthase)